MMRQIHFALVALMLGSVCGAQSAESILGKRHPDYRAASKLVTEPSTSRDPFPLDAVWAREALSCA